MSEDSNESQRMRQQAQASGLGFDGDDLTWKADTSQWPKIKNGWRCLHAAVALQNKVVVLLGGRDANKRVIKSVLFKDPSTKTWTEEPDLNGERRGHAATELNERVYCIGGWNGRHALDTIETIHVSAFTTPKEKTMRRNHGNGNH